VKINQLLSNLNERNVREIYRVFGVEGVTLASPGKEQ